MAGDQTYTMGVEEEYFVFHAETRRSIIRGNKAFIADASAKLGERLMTEMLQSQIEVATPPCASSAAVREHLTEYRGVLVEEAGRHGLGIAAVSTFPLAFWRQQEQTEKERYDTIMDDLQMVGMRNMLCGMHVHVSVPDQTSRVALMQRLVPYLPLLLALSTSSPFWQGYRTGLHGYRLAAYDELPRTGLPEPLRTEQEYDDYVAALANAGVIADASHIWWAIRPSLKHPTIELRITDVCTRVDDAVAVAALFRCLVRAMCRNADAPAPDRIGRAITVENKWRAQRYGASATFVEPFRRAAVTAEAWLEEILTFVEEDSDALDCGNELVRLRDIVGNGGSSATAQLQVYRQARSAGRTRPEALRQVIDWAAQTTAPG